MRKLITATTLVICAPVLIWANSDQLLAKVLEFIKSTPVFQLAPHRFENVPPGENEDAIATAVLMFKIKMATYAKALAQLKPGEKIVATRDAHAKGHGCVVGTFVVDKDLPEQFQTAIFSPNKSYETVVRFSNGSNEPAADSGRDGRGMAIKLLNAIAGPLRTESLLKDGTSQDFMQINHERFFARNVLDFKKFNQAIIAGAMRGETEAKNLVAPFILERLIRSSLGENLEDNVVNELVAMIAQSKQNELASYEKIDNSQKSKLVAAIGSMRSGKAPEELVIIGDMNNQPAMNPADYSEYNSMSSYLLRGRTNQESVVKYQTVPVDCNTGAERRTQQLLAANQSMHELLAERIASEDICFDFRVMVLNSKVLERPSMVHSFVENAAKSWIGHSAIQKIARITLKKGQRADELMRGCEDLSFNPWRAHQDHRPLGGINRVRRMTVTGSLIRRRLLNSNN